MIVCSERERELGRERGKKESEGEREGGKEKAHTHTCCARKRERYGLQNLRDNHTHTLSHTHTLTRTLSHTPFCLSSLSVYETRFLVKTNSATFAIVKKS